MIDRGVDMHKGISYREKIFIRRKEREIWKN